MSFITPNGYERPVRLSEQTRKFAFESLNKKYGLDTLKVRSIPLDKIEGYDALSPLEKYDVAIQRIAAEAPIRICDGERISGAATLGAAIFHVVPAHYRDERPMPSVSHLTVDFESVLKLGITGIRKKVDDSLVRFDGSEKEPFLRSCSLCLDAFEVWHGRYLEELSKYPKYRSNYENLLWVPFKPARNFYEAVQSLWFTFAFIRLCGNWPGIGRIDHLLGEYLERDLRDGVISLEEAREILAHFFIKGCEWVNGQYVGSGDAQHYQNIVLSGIDADGNDVTNDVTYLVLDIIEELGISDFPTTVRINKNTDNKLLRRVAEVMRYGGGILAVYCEETVINALLKDGYDIKEARGFANDGCWEVQVPGKTFFSYIPFDSLQILQNDTLRGYSGEASFSSFEELYQRFTEDLRLSVNDIFIGRSKKFGRYDDAAKEWKWLPQIPCTVVSLFENGCIEKGLSYFEGGPIYNITSPHIGGVADSVNSLYAIKKLVFDEKKLSFSKFMEILRNNWEGEDALRLYVRNKYGYYGNDNDEVDGLAARLLSDFSDICTSFNGKCGYRFPAGVSTFGRQLEWSNKRLASAHGRRAGEILAANCSPTPGSDRLGATAMIKSYCKADHTKLASGSALDVKLLPYSVRGENGLNALLALMRGFVNLGGFFMQPDIVDSSLLRLAQEHPEDHSTLSVRVSGWNARFVTLNKQWQDMVIEQNEH